MMSALRARWKRTKDGRMTRSTSPCMMHDAPFVVEGPCELMEKLPAHLLREVFGFLGDADLASVSATCKTFHQVCRSESLWRNVLADKLGVQADIVLPSRLPDERCANPRIWQRALAATCAQRHTATDFPPASQVLPWRHRGGASVEEDVQVLDGTDAKRLLVEGEDLRRRCDLAASR